MERPALWPKLQATRRLPASIEGPSIEISLTPSTHLPAWPFSFLFFPSSSPSPFSSFFDTLRDLLKLVTVISSLSLDFFIFSSRAHDPFRVRKSKKRGAQSRSSRNPALTNGFLAKLQIFYTTTGHRPQPPRWFSEFFRCPLPSDAVIRRLAVFRSVERFWGFPFLGPWTIWPAMAATRKTNMSRNSKPSPPLCPSSSQRHRQ